MRFAAHGALLCAVALTALGAAPQASLPAILIRMRAAAGPVYARHIVSFAHVAKPDVSIRDDMQSLRFLTSQCEGAICTGSYFDGLRYFAVNMNGTALPRTSETSLRARGLRTILSDAFLNPGFEASGGRIEDAGTASANGVTYRKLVVQNTDAIPMEIFVDPRTSLVAGLRDVNGNIFIRILHYKKVGDLDLPFEYVQAGRGVLTYDTRAVEPTAFDPPHGLAARRIRESTAALDPHTDTPIAACSLSGTPARCLIDSGNSGISISLAGMQFPAANYAVLNDIHRYGYDVVIGADVLATSPVTIDYASHTLDFAADAGGSGMTAISLEFENFVPVVAVRLGDTAASLAVDTGDESTINLSFAYYSEHTNLFKPSAKAAVSGIGGDSIELLGDIPDVQIGTYDVTSQNIGTTQTLQGTADGHLGDGFLRHFRVGLDYANGRITLRPRDGDSDVTSRRPR
jgi:hypothetical protein